MRRILLPILAFFLAVMAASPLAAQGMAVTPDGWQRSVAETGTVYFRCAASSCPTGSTVSYRQQRDGPLMPFPDFQRFQAQSNQRMVEQSNGSLRSVEMIELAQRTQSEHQVFTAVKVLHRANGTDEYFVASVLSDGQRSYSVVSSASTERAARANMDLFLPIVMLIGKMRG